MSLNAELCRNITTMCRRITFFGVRAEISLTRDKVSQGLFFGSWRNINFWRNIHLCNFVNHVPLKPASTTHFVNFHSAQCHIALQLRAAEFTQQTRKPKNSYGRAYSHCCFTDRGSPGAHSWKAHWGACCAEGSLCHVHSGVFLVDSRIND